MCPANLYDVESFCLIIRLCHCEPFPPHISSYGKNNANIAVVSDVKWMPFNALWQRYLRKLRPMNALLLRKSIRKFDLED